MAFSDFPARWDQAAAARRLPDLIASEKLPASARELERHGRLLAVVSERLTWMPGLASCPDFAGRSLHLLDDGPHESAARRAVERNPQAGTGDGVCPDRSWRMRLIRSGPRRLPAAPSTATWRAIRGR